VLARALLVLFPVLTIVGCSTTGWSKSAAIKYTKHMMVEIERRVDGNNSGNPGYAHPASVSEEKVRRFFETLTYEGEGERKVAVRKNSTGVLARAIVTGLARSDPSSRVRFSVDNPGDKDLVVFNPTTTRGVAFVEPAGVLNVAFQVVDYLYGFKDDPLWLDPTRGPDVPEKLVLPESAQFHVAKDGKVNTMWITYPVGDTQPVEPAKEIARTPPEKAKPGDKPGGGLTSDEILDRLRYLEELREEGVISEDKYRQERKKLLAK
jgi:hypothetical protein